MNMPYKSEAQRRYFNSEKGKKEIGEEEVEHWNEVSKGKKLPEKTLDKAIRLCDSIVIKNVNGHYEAYKNGMFYGSGDTKSELLKDLESENVEKKFAISFVVVRKSDDRGEFHTTTVFAKNKNEALDKAKRKYMDIAKEFRDIKVE